MSILAIATSAWIKIYQVRQGAVPISLSFYFSVNSLSCLVLYMMLTTFYIFRNFKGALDENSSIRERVGAFHEGYSVSRVGEKALILIYISLATCTLMGLVLTFGENNLLLQFYYFHFGSIMMLAVLGLLRPLVGRVANRLEFANKSFTLILFSHFLGMNELASDLTNVSSLPGHASFSYLSACCSVSE